MTTERFGSFEQLNDLFDKDALKCTASSLHPDSEELELSRQLLTLQSKGMRTIIDGVVGRSAAERKTYIQPYIDLNKALVKKMKPNSRGYIGPLRGKLKTCSKTFSVFLGWLKNRHKYKEGELLPPATVSEMKIVQNLLREKSGNSNFYLPSALCDSFLICGGMVPEVRTNPIGGLTILKLSEIPAAYEDMVKRFESSSLHTPLSDDGAGNLYAVGTDNDVYDYNHEDGTQTCIASFPKFISKAHKVIRYP